MRKIWTLRKDRDKRRSIAGVPSNSNHKHSITSFDSDIDANASMISYDNDYTEDYTIGSIPELETLLGSLAPKQSNTVLSYLNQTSNEPVSPISTKHIKSVHNLVKPDYDQRLIKNTWLNVIVNSNSVSEISEQTLKLCRAELKGSHMYLYKVPPAINAKNFRVDSSPPPLLGVGKTPLDDSTNSFHQSQPSSASLPTTPLNEGFKNPASLTTEMFKNSNGLGHTLPESDPQLPDDDISITYYSTAVPHPDLKHTTDEDGVFILLPASSSESLIHFFLFADDDAKFNHAITQIIHVLPLFPDFGKILKLTHLYLYLLFEQKQKFTGPDYDLGLIVDKVVKLFKNIDNNFSGFLLKSDIAPYILKVLETLTDHTLDVPDFSSAIQSFKSSMLAKQQSLMSLVNNESLPTADNPLQDLSSTVFMNDINLFDLASTITAIDIKFFQQWNSNIDKSLLLSSSLNGSFSMSSNNGDFLYKKNPLIFNNDYHVHYLSKLLVNHLFVEHTNNNGTSNSLEKKARLLEKWIDLGCLLDKSGNMSSWLGISSIVLSQPVLRLTRIWSLVSPDYIKLLKNDWSPVLFELDRRHLANGGNTDKFGSDGLHSPNPDKPDESASSKDSYHIMAPRGLGKIYSKEKVIPFFGDLTINNTASYNINELESIWKRINYSFSRWNEYLSNLKNYHEIIKYNEDVLRRYDNMGFIFSNESLNQVLYLGANSTDNDHPPAMDSITSSLTNNSTLNQSLTNKLLRLIEINCESTNLEKIMKLSLTLEPELPEAYLKAPSSLIARQGSQPGVPIPEIATPSPSTLTFKLNNNSSSNLSIHSNDSSVSINTNATDVTSSSTPGASSSTIPLSRNLDENNPSNKIPIFNNSYFKINLLKYDDLTVLSNGSASNNPAITHDPRLQFQHFEGPVDKHNVLIDHDLTFRIDDFVTDLDSGSVAGFGNLDDVVGQDDTEDDVPGLGIDVDDILNSDKFNNFSISQANSPVLNDYKPSRSSNGNSELKNHASFGGVSSESYNRSHSYKYIPKFASIDKLVDLLLLDSKHFDELISIDLTEFRFVFLLNYNSFISTKELLDKLAHRFINSGNAVISVMKKQHLAKIGTLDAYTLGEFPNWNIDTSVDLKELGDVDYELLLKIQINILKVLIVLINNFYSNFATDLTNKKILIKLLKLFSNEILQWYNSNKIDSSLEKSFESLVTYYKKLKKLFVRKTYRPIEILKFDEYLISEFKFSNTLHEVPMNRNLPGHKNINKIEKFLHKFNKLLTVFYKGIKAEDWIKVYKIIENQFENYSLLEFNLQKNSMNDDNLIVSNVFNFFESITDPAEKQLLLKKLPLVFRKLFKLYYKFRSYLLIQLTDLNITVDERLDRMKTLLIMTKISQLKMSDHQFVFEGHKGNIPSCIESAIVNVIYSPESRSFTNLWIKASNSLTSYPEYDSNSSAPSTTFDDINDLLPMNIKHSDLIINHEPLLPCFGWIIENVIETNKCPSYYRTIINFNKRYLIYKLIKELSVEDIESNEDVNHHDTREFEFLLKLDESLVSSQHLKEFTALEKDKTKLFKAVLRDQHKILIVDNKKKQLKENKDSTLTAGLTGSSAHALTKKTSSSSLRRQSLSYKSNSSSRFKISGLFNKTRPFSLNVSGLSNQSDRTISSRELPNIDIHLELKQKPFLVISLKGKKIFPVYLLPLCFKIDSDNSNDDFFFQAPNEGELNDWLVKLNFANRHWFYSRSITLKANHNFTTFGVPIEVTCNREQSLTPKVLKIIFDEIESEGLKDVGIYRISSSISELNNIKSTIDKTGTLNFDDKVYDTHTLTSCVKSYFRELPDALLTDSVIDALFTLKQEKNEETEDEQKILDNYKEILSTLPPVNFNTLKVLLQHLNKISQFSNDNKMTASNLATVIGPALTEASSLESLVNNFGFINSILEKLISNFHYVFELEKH